MPNAAFCTGLEVLAKFEAARVGAQWSNIFMEAGAPRIHSLASGVF